MVVLEISVCSVDVFVFYVYVNVLFLSEHNLPRGICLIYNSDLSMVSSAEG